MDDIVHVAVKLAVGIPNSRVVENTNNVTEHFIYRDTRILPSIYDTWSNILKDASCHLTGGFVKDIGEVVFAFEGISPILALRFLDEYLLKRLCVGSEQ